MTYWRKSAFSGRAAPLTPLARSSWEAGREQGLLQCLGTHLEGPLDASTSLPGSRQRAAGRRQAAGSRLRRQGCCRVSYSTRSPQVSWAARTRSRVAQPRADEAAATTPKLLLEIRRWGTPAGACCHCVLKACKVCMAWAWESFRRCQSIRVNDTYWGIELGVRERERKTAGKKFLDNVWLAAVKFIFFPRQNTKSPHMVLITTN